MSLFDVDKSSPDRSNSTPNSPDQLLEGSVKSHATLSTSYTIGDSVNNYRIQMQNNRILLLDSSNNKIGLFGPDSNNNPVFKIAKSGFSADTASNSNLIFNSGQDVFKIAVSGSTTLTPPASWAADNTITATIAHGLTGVAPMARVTVFIPFISSVFLQEGYLLPLPVVLSANSTAGGGTLKGLIAVWITYSVDSTNLYITMTNTSGVTLTSANAPFSFKYYVEQESAS